MFFEEVELWCAAQSSQVKQKKSLDGVITFELHYKITSCCIQAVDSQQI